LRQQSMVDSVVVSISTLHDSAVLFHGEVEISEVLPRYFSLLNDRDRVVLQSEFDHCQRLISVMHCGDELRVPSHNDLVLENMLLGKAQLWFIDWEYSAMASPYWDLAIVCNAAGFENHSCAQFLASYNMGSITLDLDSLTVYRRLLALLSDCWMRLFATST
jgi:hypothetical protein